MSDYSDDLKLALRLAREASTLALELHQRDLRTDLKPDGSPVTEADIAIESLLLGGLARERPADAVLSEEKGAFGNGARRWILDPLDGTSMFIDAAPGWGTLITLEDQGRSVVGAVTRPLEDSLWWAVRGAGCFHESLSRPGAEVQPCAVSTKASLDEARVTAWHEGQTGELALLARLPGWRAPSADSLRAMLCGELDAIVSVEGELWDHAPHVLLVEEAGGAFCDRCGGSRLDLEGGIYACRSLTALIGDALGWF